MQKRFREKKGGKKKGGRPEHMRRSEGGTSIRGKPLPILDRQELIPPSIDVGVPDERRRSFEAAGLAATAGTNDVLLPDAANCRRPKEPLPRPLCFPAGHAAGEGQPDTW